jgi:hypothetical protein
VPHGIGELGEGVAIDEGALPPIVVLLVPPLILQPGDALDERLDGRIGSRIGMVVDAMGGLFRPERRQGREVTRYRRLADGLRLFCGPLPLPAAALSVEDLSAEEGDQLIAGDEIAVIETPAPGPGLLPLSVCCCLGEIGEG